MNLAILHKEVQGFIDQHLKSDLTKLILKGSPFKEVSIQELATQIAAKQKALKKLPTWFQSEGIYYPPKLNLEQTSSEATALYKAKLVSGKYLVDLTGGFGIDTYFFAKQFESITHCEINSELSEIAKHNYTSLGAKNIETKALNGIEFLKQTNQSFDCIFVDPSRRNDAKGKVFLLEECLPDVTLHVDLFFKKATSVLIKLSPILDISNTLNSLQNVKEVHVVAVDNEVKELLFLLEKNWAAAHTVKTINIQKQGDQLFDFDSATEVSYSEPLTYLYEPNAAILKAGGFTQVASKLNVQKLGKHTHLYTTKNLIDFPGRRFKIEAIHRYDKKQLKRLGIAKANITIRNFPKTVAQIRKELKIKDGGNQYLFFTKNLEEKLVVILCSKVNSN